MSNRRAWYLTDADEMEEFPLAERFGSSMRVERVTLDMTAERGRRFIYTQEERRRVWTLLFRFHTQEIYDFFEDLDAAVTGDETPFYFVLDPDASPIDAVLVRKEKDFDPRPMDTGKSSGDTAAPIWDYTLTLTEEIDTEFSIDA
jgi:hypothetical protein